METQNNSCSSWWTQNLYRCPVTNKPIVYCQYYTCLPSSEATSCVLTDWKPYDCIVRTRTDGDGQLTPQKSGPGRQWRQTWYCETTYGTIGQSPPPPVVSRVLGLRPSLEQLTRASSPSKRVFRFRLLYVKNFRENTAAEYPHTSRHSDPATTSPRALFELVILSLSHVCHIH